MDVKLELSVHQEQSKSKNHNPFPRETFVESVSPQLHSGVMQRGHMRTVLPMVTKRNKMTSVPLYSSAHVSLAPFHSVKQAPVTTEHMH